MLFRLIEAPRALSDMEKDLHAYVSACKMHATIQLNVPPEIYTPVVTTFLESEIFHRRVYPIRAGDIEMGDVTIWSYRPIETPQMQEIESYLFPWILGFRHRLLSEVGRGNLFGRQSFVATELDFFKRRIWYEIERGKRYNVFLSYFRMGIKAPPDIHEERIGDGIRKILRPFEPWICFLDLGRLDLMKIGQAGAAADRFVPDIHDALKSVSCKVVGLQRYTFPKEFFEYEEFLTKISL